MRRELAGILALRDRHGRDKMRGGTRLDLQVFQMSKTERRTEVFSQFEPVLFGDGHKDVDDLGIKLAAGATPNFFAGVGHRQGPEIRASPGPGRKGGREAMVNGLPYR